MTRTARTFRDRSDAGRILARDLGYLRDRSDTVVLGLARGGLPVGREVATYLGAPLEVCIVRKVGAPQWPELALGAVASGGAVVLNDELIGTLELDDGQVRELVERETAELRRRELAYRGERAALDLSDRTVILVDDGIATGASMVAAARSVRRAGAARVIVAVPVGPTSVRRTLKREADEVVCSTMPAGFHAVGQVYADFHQMTDDEVRNALEPPKSVTD